MKIASLLAVLALVLGTTFLTGCGDKDDAGAAHQNTSHADHTADHTKASSQATTKPAASAVATCPVTGDPVDPSVPTVVFEGKTYGFCCPKCIDKFKANPMKYLTK